MTQESKTERRTKTPTPQSSTVAQAAAAAVAKAPITSDPAQAQPQEVAPQPAPEPEEPVQYLMVERTSLQLYLDGQDKQPWKFEIDGGYLVVDSPAIENALELSKGETEALIAALTQMWTQEGW